MLIRFLICLLTLWSLGGCGAGDNDFFSTTESEEPGYELRFLTQPPDVLTAQDFEVKVEVLDSFGYRTSADDYPISLEIYENPGGGSLTGRLDRYPVNGVATFSGLRIDLHGQGYRLVASSGYTYSAYSLPFNILERGGSGPGPGNRLTLLNIPSSVVAGVPVAPAIRVELRDPSNNLVTNINQDVYLEVSHGFLLGNGVATLNNGVAVFAGLAFATAGTVNVTASSLNLNQVTSPNFGVVPGPAQAVQFLTAPEGGVALGQLAPTLQAEITDDLGNRIPTASNVIQVTAQGGPGQLSGQTSKPAVGGLATFSDLSLNLAGVYQLVLSSGPLQSTSTPFTVAAGNGTRLAFQQPPPATIALGVPLRVVAAFTNANGTVLGQINGAPVTLSVLPGYDTVDGASLDDQGFHVLQQSSVAGVASFSNLFPYPAGGYNLTISAPGVPSVTASLRVTP